MGLEKLQAHKFASKMQDYKPPSDDPFDDTPDTVPNPLMTATEDYTGIYYNWKDLHQQTRKNLCSKTLASSLYLMQRAENRWQSL